MKHVWSEAGIHGVVLVAAMVLLVTPSEGASWEVLVKVIGAVAVFWLAHVYASLVTHLDDYDPAVPLKSRVTQATSYALDHSWGVLASAVIPLVVLLFGVVQVLSDADALWATLWACVAVLGVFGYTSSVSWTRHLSIRIASGTVTAVLGVLVIAMKASLT